MRCFKLPLLFLFTFLAVADVESLLIEHVASRAEIVITTHELQTSIDGLSGIELRVSLVPLLKGDSKLERGVIFLHFHSCLNRPVPHVRDPAFRTRPAASSARATGSFTSITTSGSSTVAANCLIGTMPPSFTTSLPIQARESMWRYPKQKSVTIYSTICLPG